MKEYCEETLQLCRTLLSVFSENLGLPPDHLNEAFGREDGIGICVRANYYPVCPQPELTYGLFPHSDPGGITILLQDDVVGLQVRKGDYWVPVPPVADALTINLGDQMEVNTSINILIDLSKSVDFHGRSVSRIVSFFRADIDKWNLQKCGTQLRC
jgi:isopenicillin N synthase-like dioxygenase